MDGVWDHLHTSSTGILLPACTFASNLRLSSVIQRQIEVTIITLAVKYTAFDNSKCNAAAVCSAPCFLFYKPNTSVVTAHGIPNAKPHAVVLRDIRKCAHAPHVTYVCLAKSVLLHKIPRPEPSAVYNMKIRSNFQNPI